MQDSNSPINKPWTDFNDAPVQQDYELIPKGTLVKVRMHIKAGGYNEPHMGWTDGWATRSESGAAYLNVEFVILDGQFARRKVWSLIGLFSPKGPAWGDMGRSFVRAILACDQVCYHSGAQAVPGADVWCRAVTGLLKNKEE